MPTYRKFIKTKSGTRRHKVSYKFQLKGFNNMAPNRDDTTVLAYSKSEIPGILRQKFPSRNCFAIKIGKGVEPT
jgi:hypothetical protein